MRPGRAIQDQLDSRQANWKLSRNHPCRNPISTKATNFSNLYVSQASLPVFHAGGWTISRPPFCNLVSRVFGIAAGEKVCGVTAGGIVTGVADALIVIERRTAQGEGDAMSGSHLTIKPEQAISVRMTPSFPRPAVVRPAPVNFCPESLNQEARAYGMMVGHRQITPAGARPLRRAIAVGASLRQLYSIYPLVARS
jgi:hypothetical protein